MSQITLDLPDPIFNKNDVIEYGKGKLILHIWRVIAEGTWWYSNGHFTHDGVFRYTAVVQDGRGSVNNPIRPGTLMVFGDDDFSHAKKVEWSRPIVEPDDLLNLAQRQDDWELIKS